MADIHANGKMSAKITVGTVEVYSEGIDPNLVYTKGEVNKLLDDKSDINHEHKEYLTMHQDISHLASINYVDEEIEKIELTPGLKGEKGDKGDKGEKGEKGEPGEQGLPGTTNYNELENLPNLSVYATKTELDEVKQSVSNGKTLLASAITDKGIKTLATDSFSTMANNISKITTSEEEDNTSFSVEYTLAHNTPDNTTVNNYNESKDIYSCLPRIYTSETDYSYTYDKLEITLLDGTITNDIAVAVNKVKKIKIWYPEDTIAVKFYNSNNRHLVETIEYIKTDNFTDMSYMFNFCGYLKYINFSNFNTSNVTNMRNMFNSCQGLTSLDLSRFNTSNVTNTAEMFRYCQGLTSLDVSNFNTSNVTNMSNMFTNCSSLTSLDLSNWNTSNVTFMNSMFYSCSSLTSLDLSNFNTSEVTSMSYMFRDCSSLTSLDLSNFNTSKVTSMTSMLSNVPTTVDWKYDGTNYTTFTLTKTQTGYSGTFPWN